MKSVLLAIVAVMLLAGCNSPQRPAAPPQIGRYVIVHSPQVERDTTLLDTATGHTWQLTQLSDVNGDPVVWEAVPQIDSDKDEALLVARYGTKTATPSADRSDRGWTLFPAVPANRVDSSATDQPPPSN